MDSAETQIDMHEIDASIGLLKDHKNDDQDETDIEVDKYSCTSKPVSPALSRRSEQIVEKVEDKRLAFGNVNADNSQLRKRFALSENDLSMTGFHKKTLSESFEEELKKKLCKECLFRSIQSKLSMLGIVSSSNRNIDDGLENNREHCNLGRGNENPQYENGNTISENSNTSHSTLLENLQKRKVCISK